MKHIRVEVEAAVGVITIDRPERFNSLDVETAQDLRKAGLQLARNSQCEVFPLRVLYSSARPTQGVLSRLCRTAEPVAYGRC